MANDFLDDRRAGLEEAFFAQQNEMLRQKLRDADAHKATRAELAAASGIQDDAVLDRLLGLGLGSGTVAALSLVPLVAVAWADGEISDKERAAVLSGAEGAGMSRAEAGYAVLERWLRTKPEAGLLDTWKSYVRALSATMGADTKQALRSQLLGRARAVAEATGGVLGFGNKVSASEQAVLDDLDRAFTA